MQLSVAVVVGLVLHTCSAGSTVNDCFKQVNPCNVDDRTYPPYNIFQNQLGDQACQQACLDQNSKGILAADANGATKTQYCQLAVSRPGVCKLYYQTNIIPSTATRKHKRGAYAPTNTNQNYNNQPQQQQQPYGPRSNQGNQGYNNKNNNQGSQWGPRTNSYGNQQRGNQGGNGGNCFALQPGCPGYGGANTSAPAGNGTTPAPGGCWGAKQTKEVSGNAINFYQGPTDFDGTSDDCKKKCGAAPTCVSINYYPKNNGDEAQCVIHDVKCDPSATAKQACTDRTDTEYYEKQTTC
jgi:hypothetical protein